MTDRRDVLKALAALPGVAAVERLEVGPKDIVVFKTNQPMPLSRDQRERLLAAWNHLWEGTGPKPRAIVLDNGMDIAVVREKT